MAEFVYEEPMPLGEDRTELPWLITQCASAVAGSRPPDLLLHLTPICPQAGFTPQARYLHPGPMSENVEQRDLALVSSSELRHVVRNRPGHVDQIPVLEHRHREGDYCFRRRHHLEQGRLRHSNGLVVRAAKTSSIAHRQVQGLGTSDSHHQLTARKSPRPCCLRKISSTVTPAASRTVATTTFTARPASALQPVPSVASVSQRFQDYNRSTRPGLPVKGSFVTTELGSGDGVRW